jgi:hypothetical protein
VSLRDVFLIKEDVYHQHWTSDGKRYNVGMLYDYAKAVTEPEEVPLDALQKQFEKTNVDEEKWSDEFVERCQNTSLKYPILVVIDDKKRMWIADGNHRYGKAVMQGDEMIQAYVVRERDLPEKAIEPKPSIDDQGSHHTED